MGLSLRFGTSPCPSNPRAWVALCLLVAVLSMGGCGAAGVQTIAANGGSGGDNTGAATVEATPPGFSGSMLNTIPGSMNADVTGFTSASIGLFLLVNNSDNAVASAGEGVNFPFPGADRVGAAGPLGSVGAPSGFLMHSTASGRSVALDNAEWLYQQSEAAREAMQSNPVGAGPQHAIVATGSSLNENFQVFQWNPPTYVTRSATRKVVGVNCYVYVDDTLGGTKDGLAATIANAFDVNIYNAEHAAFGAEDSPGIDNDPKVFILISNAINASVDLGYFNPIDGVAPQGVSNSNGGQILYIQSDVDTDISITEALAVVAHEFQHMINFNMKTRAGAGTEENWINEGLSQIAIDVCGYGLLAGNGYEALGPADYLADPPNFPLRVASSLLSPTQYGEVYLFIRYLMDHYGGNAVLHGLEASALTGPANVAAVTGERFPDTFTKWAFANLFQGAVPPGGTYTYTSINVNGGVYGGVLLARAVFPITVTDALQIDNFTMLPWTARYYLYTSAGVAPRTLRATITGVNSNVGAYLYKK